VKLTVDTNVLVRAVVRDDLKQGTVAARILREAERIAVPTVVLCEFVWVLRRVYHFSSKDIARAIRALAASKNVELNRAAVDAGLAVLGLGGDFADGVIAHEGKWLGGELFASFDREAVTLLKAQGHATKLL
jgi:predicted nucleic-acid-binding protein